MPKRIGYRFEQVCDYSNCLAAVDEVIRAKDHHSLYAGIYETSKPRIKEIMTRRANRPRRQRVLDLFKQNREEVARRISEELSTGTWVPEPYRARNYYDNLRKKVRCLKVPCLYDQCVHHAIMRITAPDLQKRFSYHDCGSVPGAGQSRAADCLRRWMRAPAKQRPKYACNLDVRHFFENCSAEVVMGCLRRIYKDEKFLQLHQTVLDSMGSGLAIGFYPSPWYANLVLECYVDRRLKDKYRRTVQYIRYMDDICLTSRNRRKLRQAAADVSSWMQEAGLELKASWQVYPLAAQAIPFLTYRYWYGKTLVRKAILYRITRIARRAGRGLSPALAMAVQSHNGILDRCNSWRVRKEWIRPYITDRKCRRLIKHVTNLDRVLSGT